MISQKVLVVEDSPVVRMMIADMVNALGFEAFPVASAEAARGHLVTGEFDVLLSDLGLGVGASGEDLVNDTSLVLPTTVVLMSGNPKPCNLSAETRYISKPFTLSQLAAVLHI